MKQTRLQFNIRQKKQNYLTKIGMWLSITILVLVVLGLVGVYTHTHVKGVFLKLDASLLLYFSFFINIIAAIISIINIVEFALMQKNKLLNTHKWLHICNLMVASSLAFNFLFTNTYLMGYSVSSNYYYWLFLITGSNLFFNAIVPVLFSFLYIFCFKNIKLKNKWISLISTIPTFIYFIIYISLALTNSNYDIYFFGSKYQYLVIIAFLICSIITSFIGFGFYQLNQISKINRWALIAVINVFLSVCIIAFTGFMFYTNITDDRFKEGLTVAESIGTRFLLFTHLSNWWVGISSIIYSVYAIKIYKGYAKQIPIWAQIVRLAGVAAILITLAMQLVIASSCMINAVDWEEALQKAYLKCFRKHLIFQHFLNPMIAMASFIVLEHSDLRWKHLLHSATPLAIYALVYVILLYCHLDVPLRKDLPHPAEQTSILTWWDVYDLSAVFGKIGRYVYWFLPGVIYAILLLLNFVFWICNRKIHFDLPKKGPAFVELKQDWLNWRKAKNNKK